MAASEAVQMMPLADVVKEEDVAVKAEKAKKKRQDAVIVPAELEGTEDDLALAMETWLGMHGPVIFNVWQSLYFGCLLYTSPSPRDRTRSRMPSSA